MNLEEHTENYARAFWADAAEHYLTRGLDISPYGLVVDVGAYRGAFTNHIRQTFDCRVAAYEPIKLFYLYLVTRFSDDPNVVIFNTGLENKNRKAQIAEMAEGSSMFYPTRRDAEYVTIWDASIELKQWETIDLLAINGEGCEFSLLNGIIESGVINQVKNILVQFHTFFPDAENEREQIRQKLELTHRQRWCYPFVWEAWVLKS